MWLKVPHPQHQGTLSSWDHSPSSSLRIPKLLQSERALRTSSSTTNPPLPYHFHGESETLFYTLASVSRKLIHPSPNPILPAPSCSGATKISERTDKWTEDLAWKIKPPDLHLRLWNWSKAIFQVFTKKIVTIKRNHLAEGKQSVFPWSSREIPGRSLSRSLEAKLLLPKGRHPCINPSVVYFLIIIHSCTTYCFA